MFRSSPDADEASSFLVVEESGFVTSAGPPQTQPAASPDPAELLRSRSYLALLILGAIAGLPIAAVAYFFLKAVAELQHYVYQTLPGELGYQTAPTWWPLPLLALSGLLVALSIRYLPGTSGHKPAEGFKASGPVPPIELPGIFAAAFATLALGAVLGPEAPLIAIGSGLGVLAIQLVKRDAPQMAHVVLGVTGSFAAIATLLGSPIVGAFLLMEVAGLGGALLGVVLVPGLLAAGIGSLIFIGLDSWTGYGTFSLAVPDIPSFGTPTGAEFLWAIAIGLAAAVLGSVIKRLALTLQPIVERRPLLLTPLVGLAVAGLAIAFAEGSEQGLVGSALLRPGRSPLAHRPGRDLDRRRARAARRLQGPRVCAVPERVPRRTDLPGHVHRRRGRDRAVSPPRPAHDRRGCDGHRRDDRGHARPAADLRPDHEPLSPVRRCDLDAARDRRRGGVLRRVCEACRRPPAPHRDPEAPTRPERRARS